MKMPAEIETACRPLFEELPIERAMDLLKGSKPTLSELVEQIVQQEAIAAVPELAAGLWLYVDDLERSHAILQDLESLNAAYWHGIMHRREGDYSNSRYWMRKAAEHPLLHEQAGTDSLNLIARTEAAGGRHNTELIEMQRREWETLFEYCSTP